jgi:uncharacterized protein DUF6566
MSRQLTYREYTISSVPVKLADKNEWKPEIEISSQRDGIVTSKPYTDETIYPTEEAADAHGIQLGQEIIDGKAPVISVNYDERQQFNAKTPFERM